MKKLLFSLVTLTFVTASVLSPAFAVPGPTQTLGVDAEVPDLSPEVDIIILKITDGDPDQNPWTNSTDVTTSMSLSFGELAHTYVDPADGLTKESGVWYSPVYYAVIVFAQGYGSRYEVRSTCTGIGTIPNSYNYFRLTPVYASADQFIPGTPQGSRPIGSVMGSDGNAINTAYRLVYRSEVTPSTPRIIQAYYSIPSRTATGSIPYSGWTGIPLTATPGSFVGTVTISIVAI